MTDRTTFRHDVLNAHYADAERALASLPAPERTRRLSDIARQLDTIDRQPGMGDAEVARLALAVVKAAPASGAPPTRPERVESAVRKTLPSSTRLSPTIAIDSQDGIPIIRGEPPRTWGGMQSALYEVGQVVADRMSGNAFSPLSPRLRRLLLIWIENVNGGIGFAGERRQALTVDQDTQLRASCSTILFELLSASLGVDDPLAQQDVPRSLQLLMQLARAETHPGLRDSIALGLVRIQGSLPAKLRAEVDALTRAAAPLAPPYEAWLRDGVVGCDLAVDGDWVTVDALRAHLEAQGFAQRPGADPHTLRRTVTQDGRSTVIEVRLRTSYGDLFCNVGDAGTDIVFYMGHADYGRNIPRSIPERAGGDGSDQLLMFATCFGKDNLQQVRARYPQAEVMATFRAAYHNEAFAALRATWDGIAKRSTWDAISADLGGPERGNWVTPAEVMLRRRVLDRDGDGRADIFDRQFDVDLQKVASAYEQAFVPRDPGVPPHRLQSLYGVTSANWMNRGVGAYNEALLARTKDQQVVADGFFAGSASDPPVRFSPVTLPEGRTGLRLQINDRFAHMPDEVLRTVTAWEYNAYIASDYAWFAYHDDPLRARVNGLMAVAFTLSHDRYSNDEQTWQGFLAAYGLPKELSLDEVERFARRDGAGDRYQHAGCTRNINALIEYWRETKPEILKALQAPGGAAWRMAR